MNVIHYIIFILFFLIMYSVSFKNIEGFDDDFYYYDKLIDYKTLPNSYVNDATPSKTVNKFGFYKGKGIFKKEYKETKSDEKISTLNKLLNRLLGRIVSDNQDCVGSFGRYSECDKSCGSNAFQTRKYNITQERGKNGKDCPFVDGYEEKLRCNLDECQLEDICENNEDCETGNCNPDSTRCENMVPCDSDNVHLCNETQCINLNNSDDNNDNDNIDKMVEGTYIYNNVDQECFFKTPAEIEELNLNIYTYDFGEIRGKVKDIVLDCEYYQVEKEEGVGPCVNIPNIIMEDDEPICKPGYGPEPTMFNKEYACKECIIPKVAKTESGCYCNNVGEFNNESGLCGPPDLTTTENICNTLNDPDRYIKKGDDDCSYCDTKYAYKKNGDNISCIQCPLSSSSFDEEHRQRTLSDYCKNECDANQLTHRDDEQIDRCNNLCGGLYTSSLPESFFDKFKKNLDGVEYSDTMTVDELINERNYQEKCLDIFTNQEAPSQRQSEPDGYCPPGQYQVTGSIGCTPCDPHTHCGTSNENKCVEYQETYNVRPTSSDPSHVQECLSIVEQFVNNYELRGGEMYSCDPGQSSEDGSCRMWCPAGKQDDGSGTCVFCPVGHYNDERGGNCHVCELGYIGPNRDSCEDCDPNSEIQLDGDWEQLIYYNSSGMSYVNTSLNEVVSGDSNGWSRCACNSGYERGDPFRIGTDGNTGEFLERRTEYKNGIKTCTACDESSYKSENDSSVCNSDSSDTPLCQAPSCSPHSPPCASTTSGKDRYETTSATTTQNRVCSDEINVCPNNPATAGPPARTLFNNNNPIYNYGSNELRVSLVNRGHPTVGWNDWDYSSGWSPSDGCNTNNPNAEDNCANALNCSNYYDSNSGTGGGGGKSIYKLLTVQTHFIDGGSESDAFHYGCIRGTSTCLAPSSR